ncbi:MAG: aminopeptidase, partial [Thermoleophilaceae bacterium]|nr:aminopeptidase [Thermoleophilaceae bacterium]
MKDPRVTALAQILVNYSTRVQPGETCVIQSEIVAAPLVQAVYEEVLIAGGLPIVQMALPEQAPAFFKLANDQQLEWISPTATWIAENVDTRIAIMADTNTRALSNVDPARQSQAQKARK